MSKITRMAESIVAALAIAAIGLSALPAQAATTPVITGYKTYQQGVMVVLSVSYIGTADGFTFVGIDGSGWAEENHPLSSPGYGTVSPGNIEYPFNSGCGTASAYQSDVAFRVYNGDGGSTIDVHLACTTVLPGMVIPVTAGNVLPPGTYEPPAGVTSFEQAKCLATLTALGISVITIPSPTIEISVPAVVEISSTLVENCGDTVLTAILGSP
jgi:hypothetical protein